MDGYLQTYQSYNDKLSNIRSKTASKEDLANNLNQEVLSSYLNSYQNILATARSKATNAILQDEANQQSIDTIIGATTSAPALLQASYKGGAKATRALYSAYKSAYGGKSAETSAEVGEGGGGEAVETSTEPISSGGEIEMTARTPQPAPTETQANLGEQPYQNLAKGDAREAGEFGEQAEASAETSAEASAETSELPSAVASSVGEVSGSVGGASAIAEGAEEGIAGALEASAESGALEEALVTAPEIAIPAIALAGIGLGLADAFGGIFGHHHHSKPKPPAPKPVPLNTIQVGSVSGGGRVGSVSGGTQYD